MTTISAVIPVKNVEKIIRGTIDSLWFCKEVILVDMYSTDKTKEIATSYPNVKFFEKNGYIFENFNFGMEQATSEWIIRMDSDERLSPELQEEILKTVASNPTENVFTAPYYSYFVGKSMLHGGKFQTREVLFKKGSLAYPVRSEHEAIAPLPGVTIKSGELKGAYLHFSCPSIKKYIDKIKIYWQNTALPLRLTYKNKKSTLQKCYNLLFNSLLAPKGFVFCEVPRNILQ
mgnify:CR=1 FL=1